MSPALVEIEAVNKQFPKAVSLALDGVTAEIPYGKIVGLVGPDGAGKTTLLRLIAGLLQPTQGSITIDGQDPMMGYMPQKFGLYDDLTVLQNLQLYADLRYVVGPLREETFTKLLGFTGLAPFTKRLAGKLSGGMKQKLGLACALIKKPTLLLLDEPSVGVDPLSRRELWQMVHQLLEDRISVVWSTAYLDEAEKCDIVLLLNEGKLLYYGKPAELTKRVAGRVFMRKSAFAERRKMLFEILHRGGVIDAVIQGKGVRIVVAEGGAPPPEAIPVEPRFEDGFIDILGGVVKEESALAKLAPALEITKEAVIVADRLTKRFDSFVAVDNVSFTVSQGEIFGLLGPNGAGKSTIFKILCGLLHPTEGGAFVNKVSLETASSLAKRQIGYMAQKFSLYGSLSVYQNLKFFSGIYGLKGKGREKAVQEMVEIFGLQPYLNISAETLPLGFKQRLALACSHMHHPKILFLDEPTSGVDPLTRREFWSHINGLVAKGVTVMITTHFMEEAEYCDRIALIYRGKIIHMDNPDALKEIAKSVDNQNPTLEDAFIQLIQEYDHGNK